MPIFSYKGIDASGKKTSGSIDAENLKIARTKLKKINIFPTEVKEGKSSGGSGKKGFSLFKGVKINELASMTRQLATLVGANIPLVDALTALTEQIENPKLKDPLNEIREKVTEGGRLSDAMRAYPHVFSDLYVSMIAAGEASGAFDLVLKRLADFTENQASLRSKVRSAMIYPVIMGVVGFILVTFLLVSVVPEMSKVFDDMKAKLPLPTRMLRSISNMVSSYPFWLVILGGIPLFIFAFTRFKRSARGKRFLDQMNLRLPVFGSMFRMVAISRFSRTLATLMSSGVQLLPALEIVKNVVQNSILAGVIDDTKNSVKEGESIADPMRRSGQFPPILIHMIAIGEKTGELEGMLERVADSYDQQVDEKASTLAASLAPIMILLMGAAVGFIVISMMMPMLDLNKFAR